MKTRDGKSSNSAEAPFEFWPGHCSTFAFARLFWIAVGPGVLMTLCVLRMDADRSNHLFLSTLYFLTVLLMLVTRWVYFMSASRNRHDAGDEWKHAIGFSVAAVILSAGVWTVARTVSDAQTATLESGPAETAAPMLSEREMFTQTL